MESRTHSDVVLEAQIDHLYRQLPRLLVYSLLVSLALAAMLRGAIPTPHIAGWFTAMVAVIFARAALHALYRRHPASATTRTWARWYVVMSGLAGVTWGSAGVVLFAPHQIELQALVLLVLAGMGAGSASVLPMYLPAFYAYLPASMIPAGIMMFLQAGRFHVFMGIFDFIFLFGVLAFGRAIGAAFEDSLKLRFENIDLVAELKRQKAELERANLAKSKFLAAASHDLRQPLHALSLFSELLERQTEDQRTQELVNHIGASIGVLERLFSALLDISRIDAGVLKPDFEVFPIRAVVDQVFHDSLPHAEERGLRLFVDCGEDFTRSDPTLLERILRNLVSNAIRYTKSGNVTIRCRRVAGKLQLSVIDTGIGIAEHHKSLIFEEFTQLHNPQRDRSQGMGLGLSIVRRLAGLLDHSLTLRSNPGTGSEFSLTLPHEVSRQRSTMRSLPAALQPGARLDLVVLVVDDDPEILEGTRRLLESWGCAVHTSETAETAVETARALDRLDALITDFRLPKDTRGIQVVESARALFGTDLPALLITGDMEPALLQEAQALNLELLHKPVRPARLRAWLQKISSA